MRTNCPGVLTWWLDDGECRPAELVPVGGVMVSVKRYHLTLGPFPEEADAVRFVFGCTHERCDRQGVCRRPEEYAVQIV